MSRLSDLELRVSEWGRQLQNERQAVNHAWEVLERVERHLSHLTKRVEDLEVPGTAPEVEPGLPRIRVGGLPSLNGFAWVNVAPRDYAALVELARAVVDVRGTEIVSGPEWERFDRAAARFEP